MKNKIMRKRTAIIHPRVLFQMDVEQINEAGNKTFEDLVTSEEKE